MLGNLLKRQPTLSPRRICNQGVTTADTKQNDVVIQIPVQNRRRYELRKLLKLAADSPPRETQRVGNIHKALETGATK